MSVTSGTVYKLINAQAGNALDLSGADNKSIIGYGFHNGDNQKWEVYNQGSQWVFKNKGTGKFLGLESAPNDGTPLAAVDSPIAWDIWPDEADNTVHRIFVPNTTFVIDLSDHGNPNPGTPITLWTNSNWNSRNQCWRFDTA